MNEVPPIVHDVLRSPGQPLDAATRAFMDPRFGHDFSRVRVHTDTAAAGSAQNVNALAHTAGRNVVFGAGQFAPGTSSGRQLLAHELTHVVQQSAAGDPPSLQGRLTVNDPGDASEREADSIAADVLAARPVRAIASTDGVSPKIQRACGPGPIGAPTSCTNLLGDIVGERFRFKKDCDDFLAGEQARLELFARTFASGESIDIHGFASRDGDPIFNENLSCARAIKAQSVVQGILTSRALRASVNLFNHGATADADPAKQRSVVISRSGIAPPPSAPGCTAPTNPDFSGRVFNPTTSSENAVIAAHPLDAFSVNGAANDSFAAAAASGLPGAHLGPQDAFRHCVWNCLMTQRIGAGEAEQFATGHENSGPSAIPFDNQMDLHDNVIGRGLGAPAANCETACLNAVTSGQLRTVRGPDGDTSAATEGLAASGVTPACIGASDQPWP